MKKIASLWMGALVLAWFTGCVPEDKSSGPGDEKQASYGKAEVLLPALPPGFLAKRAADTLDTLDPVDPMFILTISGNGMITRKQAWPLGSTSRSVLVSNLPAGSRLFTGQLEIGGNITHADSVMAFIEAGKTAVVRLKLGKVSGNALICVEIEGLPLPAGCNPKPSYPYLAGCWSFTWPKDSLTRHSLRILQIDSQLQAEIVWRDGTRDTSRGTVQPNGWVTLGLNDSVSTWYFSGRVDTVDTNSNTLHGTFWRKYAEPRSFVFITPIRIPCAPIYHPPFEPDSALSCWGVAQTLDGKSTEGRLSLLKKRDNQLLGFFMWDCCTGMPVNGKAAPVNGNEGLYLNGNLPFGLATKPTNQSDPVHYKGQVPPNRSSIQFGTLYGTDQSGATVQRGIWKGYPVQCTDKDLSLALGPNNFN